jgi:hypothetical protein
MQKAESDGIGGSLSEKQTFIDARVWQGATHAQEAGLNK